MSLSCLQWALEYGMPSTHAMVGLAVPAASIFFTFNRFLHYHCQQHHPSSWHAHHQDIDNKQYSLPPGLTTTWLHGLVLPPSGAFLFAVAGSILECTGETHICVWV